jgi:hypothetical protein
MTKMTIMIASAAALLVAASSGAQDAPASKETPSATPDPDKKVCRREQALGSFLSKSVCHTRREWATIDNENGVNAENALARRRTGVPGRN